MVKRWCACYCWRHPYRRIADYVEAVLCRIGRERTIWQPELPVVAWRLANKYSSNAPSTIKALQVYDAICITGGQFCYGLSKWDLRPERAWEEGRQCVPLGNNDCGSPECGRVTILGRWLCPGHQKRHARARTLEHERKAINSLLRQLKRTIKEARRGDEFRRAA